VEQLSGLDSLFLSTEQGNVYNHVAALGIYDPSTAPGGKVRFKSVLNYFRQRLGMSKVFRRRLVTVPHDLDRPYWIDGAEPDLEFHVRHIALPEPGDWRQLMIQVARLHSRPLDRSRPLWEVYVIEGLHRIPGLPRGSFAIMLKFHHAAVDGQAAAALLKAVHALTADADDTALVAPTVYAEREPTSAELYTRAVVHGVARAGGIARLYVDTIGKIGGLSLTEIVRRVRKSPEDAPLPGFFKAPATRFNRPVSANRIVEAVGFPLAPLNTARRKLEGATINDLFLAIVGGALRSYLAAKDELPEESLTALMPISVRRPGTHAPGNEVGGVPVPLRTDVAEPLARLAAVRQDAEAAKRDADALGRGLVMAVTDVLPAFAAEAFMRYAVYPQLNVTVSNVRGPETPLYIAGARLVHFYPLSIATDYVGLNHTGFSYNGVLWITAVACRNMMPDPQFYAECLRESHASLMRALDALPEPGAVAPKRSARASRRGAAAAAPDVRARKRRPRSQGAARE
jgi:WS/DGAT/MGAT family acyltransferase